MPSSSSVDRARHPRPRSIEPAKRPRGGRSLDGAPADVKVMRFELADGEFAVVSFVGAPISLPAGLTSAERAIVAAVVEGRSNAEIARQRGTSPRTIANQMAAVYQKLKLSSRAELAARCLAPAPRRR
jgi:DNA-binding NarL/FixJ family response regulator